jgi:heme/copper-type cytochrome/quinol oxidase subunit 1
MQKSKFNFKTHSYLSKPHKFFLFLAVSLYFVEYFRTKIYGVVYFDIPLHDTYLVIAHFHVITGISILILITGFIYWLGEKWVFNYSKILTFLHILSVLFFIVLLNNSKNATSKTYNNFESFEAFKTGVKFMYALTISFWSSVLFFISNFILGFLNKAK